MRPVLTALGLVIGAALPGAPLSVSAGTDTSRAADLASSPLWLGLIGGGLLAVAALAILGGAWLGSRRRRRRPSEARLSGRPGEAVRLARRRGLPDADDPILASMGLGRPPPAVGPKREPEPAAGDRTRPKRRPRV